MAHKTKIKRKVAGQSPEATRDMLESHGIPWEFWPREALKIAGDIRRIDNDEPNTPYGYSPYTFVVRFEDPYTTETLRGNPTTRRM